MNQNASPEDSVHVRDVSSPTANLAVIKKEVWRRHPMLFAVLVTIGGTATFTGIEQLLLSVEFLRSHPVVILGLGMLLLLITGTVYKKLG
jgi:protein-S-isoprenylcysteine O-methyltransferase Ste14